MDSDVGVSPLNTSPGYHVNSADDSKWTITSVVKRLLINKKTNVNCVTLVMLHYFCLKAAVVGMNACLLFFQEFLKIFNTFFQKQFSIIFKKIH